MSSEEQWKRDKLIYNIIVDRYQQEWNRINDLDSKASTLMGFAGLLATLTAAIMEFLPETSNRYLFLIPLGLFVSCAVIALSGYWIMDYEAIEPEALIHEYKDKGRTEVLRKFVATTAEMTMFINLQNQRKVKSIYRAFSVLGISIGLFLTISIVILIG